mgnify:FL=1
MFRPMRRAEKEVSTEIAWEILKKGTWGSLSVNVPEGFPYGVPVNYIVWNGRIIFHSAPDGQKIDAINADSKACFTVVTKAEIVKEKISTRFESVIAFGSVNLVEENREEILRALAYGYGPVEDNGFIEKRLEKGACKALLFEFVPQQISGKINNAR